MLWEQIQSLYARTNGTENVAQYENDLKIHVWDAILDMISNNYSALVRVNNDTANGKEGKIVVCQILEELLQILNSEQADILNSFPEGKQPEMKEKIELIINKISSAAAGNDTE